MQACQHGHTEVAKLLIANNAHVGIKSKVSLWFDKWMANNLKIYHHRFPRLEKLRFS